MLRSGAWHRLMLLLPLPCSWQLWCLLSLWKTSLFMGPTWFGCIVLLDLLLWSTSQCLGFLASAHRQRRTHWATRSTDFSNPACTLYCHASFFILWWYYTEHLCLSQLWRHFLWPCCCPHSLHWDVFVSWVLMYRLGSEFSAEMGRCQCGTPLFRLPLAVLWLGPGWELSLFLSTGTDPGRFGPSPVPLGQLLDFWLASSLLLSGSTGIANNSPTSSSEEKKDTITGHQEQRERDPGCSQKMTVCPSMCSKKCCLTLRTHLQQ